MVSPYFVIVDNKISIIPTQFLKLALNISIDAY